MVNANDIASMRDRLKKVEAVAVKVSKDGTATMAFKNGMWRDRLRIFILFNAPPPPSIARLGQHPARTRT